MSMIVGFALLGLSQFILSFTGNETWPTWWALFYPVIMASGVVCLALKSFNVGYETAKRTYQKGEVRWRKSGRYRIC